MRVTGSQTCNPVEQACFWVRGDKQQLLASPSSGRVCGRDKRAAYPQSIQCLPHTNAFHTSLRYIHRRQSITFSLYSTLNYKGRGVRWAWMSSEENTGSSISAGPPCCCLLTGDTWPSPSYLLSPGHGGQFTFSSLSVKVTPGEEEQGAGEQWHR